MIQRRVLQRLFLTLLHLELVDILERLQMDSRDFLHFDLLDAILFLSFLVFQKLPEFHGPELDSPKTRGEFWTGPIEIRTSLDRRSLPNQKFEKLS